MYKLLIGVWKIFVVGLYVDFVFVIVVLNMIILFLWMVELFCCDVVNLMFCVDGDEEIVIVYNLS